jgi:predicted ribosome quality control (RQC) complex YloA/Tae2 family protein
MLSSLDITRILAESSPALLKANITGIEYYRKERTVQVYLKSDKRYAVTLSFHPQRSGFYILGAGKSRIETTEKYRPFAKEVWGGNLAAISQVPNDRIVETEITVSDHRWFLIFEILGPNANLWLLDGDRKLASSLRQKKFTPGQTYAPTPLPTKLDPNGITADDLRQLLADNPDVNPARLMEKNIYGLDYFLARTLLPETDELNDDQIDKLHRRLRDVMAAFHSSEGSIYAYYIKGKSRYSPVKISDYEPLGKYKSVSRAQREVMAGLKEHTETETLRDRTLRSIQTRIKKTKRLLTRLKTDIEEAADYEKYLRYADLLKINIASLQRGLPEIEVDDLFGGEDKIIIPLDAKLTGPENIEAYSKRYRKGKDGLAILERREQNTRQELESLIEALEYFENNFDTASQEYPELLPPPTGEPAAVTGPRLPYKEYQTSTGVTVLVGKTEADNDRLTLEYAKPHELWFHASQCPGSHVVMKFPHKKFEPSKFEIEEVAALAAYYSRARKSAKVPVSYTLKKHVRKPRGAKPGLVTIQREKTILVEPRELEKKDSS